MSTHNDHQTVVKSYSKQATIYDERFRHYLEVTLSTVMRTLKLKGNEEILDVACGTGEFERRALPQFPNLKITGVDVSQHMIDEAKRKLADFPQINWMRASSLDIPLRDERYDIVLNCSAFHYMRHPAHVIKELARLTKPGGRVLILDWCRDFFFAKMYNFIRQAYLPAHMYVYSLDELIEMIKAAGLKIDTTETFSCRPFWRMMCVTAIKG